MLNNLLDANTTLGMAAFNAAGVIGLICIIILLVRLINEVE